MDIGLTETCSRLTEASARVLERTLEELFENPVRIPGTGMAEAPVIGNRYIVQLGHDHLLPVIVAAMIAKEKFRTDAPGWPPLPLTEEDCETLTDDDDPRANVLGYFGASQRGERWSSQHPGFSVFVSGLLADKRTPKQLRTNRELLEEFPPVKLHGMCNGWLTWRSDETLRLDRKNRRMIREHEAHVAAGS